MRSPGCLSQGRAGRASAFGSALALLLAAGVEGSLARDGAAAEPVAVEPKVLFKLSEAQGRPGDLVTLVLSVVTNVALKSVQLAIDFDETKLRLEEAALALGAAGPSPVEGVSKTDVDNRNDSPGSQPQEGWIYLELTASDSTGDLKWPEGVDVPVYKLLFRILDGAPAGPSPVVFAKVGPENLSPQLLNKYEAKTAVMDPAAVEVPPEDLVDGTVIILGLGEIGFFLRADTNLDLVRDISDPVRTLNFLFQANSLLSCEDAADANDDGKIDVSDAIFTLYWLYSGGKPPPEPAQWGADPTPDRLCCEETGGCS